MSEDVLTDDQSHYEVSLTAGQAFLAFVLMLLSLAASFAFGLMIGRSKGDDHFSARKETAVINETGAAKAQAARVVEQSVDDGNDFRPPANAKTAAADAVIIEENSNPTVTPDAVAPVPAAARVASRPPVAKPLNAPTAHPSTTAAAVPHFAQILSTSDQHTAEALAAKLIDGGFSSAYVERGTTDKGGVFRVRVRFPSEAEARAAEPKLRVYSKDVWITSR